MLQTGANTHQENSVDQNEDRRAEILYRSLKVGKEVPGYPCNEKNLESQIFNNVSDKDITITLLKKEIESALRSLRVVQAQMIKLQNEKKEMLINEKQNRQNLQCLMNQVLVLQETIKKFDKQSENVMEALNHRLKAFEQNVLEAGSRWCLTKEVIQIIFLTIFPFLLGQFLSIFLNFPRIHIPICLFKNCYLIVRKKM